MRASCTLLLLVLLVSSSLHAAETPAWDGLKQLHAGQQVRVVLKDGTSVQGRFQSLRDDAIVINAKGTDQVLSRPNVQQVAGRGPSHRLRNTLIGAGIGAGGGLITGAAIDSDCSSRDIVCTGNYGKAILTPAFAAVGAAIGALIPTGHWQSIYRSN